MRSHSLGVVRTSWSMRCMPEIGRFLSLHLWWDWHTSQTRTSLVLMFFGKRSLTKYYRGISWNEQRHLEFCNLVRQAWQQRSASRGRNLTKKL